MISISNSLFNCIVIITHTVKQYQLQYVRLPNINMGMRLKLLIFCLFTTGVSFAQNKTDSTDTHKKHDNWLHLFGGQNAEDARKGKPLITSFIFPGYSPDIQYSLAAGAVVSFKTNRADSLLPRSSVPITFTYSTIKSFIASAGFTTFWLHDKLRINSLIQYKLSRDAYYGVGYQNAINTSFPDSTRFWRSFFIFQVRPLWKIRKHMFAGVSLDYSQNILWGVNAHTQKDPFYNEYGVYIRNAGVGAILSYDSRDYPQNPYHGIYSSIIYTVYGKSLGGNTDFQALDFDTRFFIPLSATKAHTLAINLRSRYDFGEAPFTSMISLGTSNDLRGFRFGQFRDYYMNYAIAEYRHKIYTGGHPTKFGFVAWTGVGAIGDNFNQALYQQPLPDFGVGLRYEVQPRLNLRIDFGFAPSRAGTHNGTYFNFLEAY